MKRLVLVALATLALVAPAGAWPPIGLQVSAREYSFVLSTDKVRSGKLAIELVNFGQDPHNLVLRRGQKTIESVLVPAGQRAELDVQLKQGTYELYCSLLDHQARGMETTLQVRDRKRF